MSLDLRGLTPAPVTPFTRDGQVDHNAIQRLGSWLGSIDGVKGLVVLGHAGEEHSCRKKNKCRSSKALLNR